MKWKQITCHECGGHGQVPHYTMSGDDFLGAKECDVCNGSGLLSVSPGGAIAQYPGGPFVGRLSRKELEHESS